MLFSKGLQCTIPLLCYNTVFGSSQLVVVRFVADRLLSHPRQRSHDSPPNCHRYCRARLRRARMDNIQRVWLEGVQVSWS